VIRAAEAAARECGIKLHEYDAVLAEQELAAGQAQYGKTLRGIVSQLWRGGLDLQQAFVLFESTVNLSLTSAWHSAARSVGILPSELSPEERTMLIRIIADEIVRIIPFLLDVETGNRASGGKLGPFLARANMWALRYADVWSLALTMARNDPKLTWLINITRIVKRNCPSCLRMNGKTKRASFFRRKGIRPQNPPNGLLICGGWL